MLDDTFVCYIISCMAKFFVFFSFFTFACFFIINNRNKFDTNVFFEEMRQEDYNLYIFLFYHFVVLCFIQSLYIGLKLTINLQSSISCKTISTSTQLSPIFLDGRY